VTTRARDLRARPGYRRLWTARTVSQVGDVAQFTTLALLLVHLTGSAVGVTGAVLAEIAAVLLLGPIAGSLVDRLPRFRVMVTADGVRVLLAMVLAVWHGTPAVAYAVAFGLAAGQTFLSPASQSLLPSRVTDDEPVAANSRPACQGLVSCIDSRRGTSILRSPRHERHTRDSRPRPSSLALTPQHAPRQMRTSSRPAGRCHTGRYEQLSAPARRAGSLLRWPLSWCGRG